TSGPDCSPAASSSLVILYSFIRLVNSKERTVISKCYADMLRGPSISSQPFDELLDPPLDRSRRRVPENAARLVDVCKSHQHVSGLHRFVHERRPLSKRLLQKIYKAIQLNALRLAQIDDLKTARVVLESPLNAADDVVDIGVVSRARSVSKQ